MTRLKPPLAPMEALSVDTLPEGPEWQYEPKWDGFRCLVFCHGDEVALQSKAGKPLTRYFPDIVAAVKKLNTPNIVLDGEIVVPRGRRFSFDDLLQRIHPAASRVKKLAAETPALLILFDLLQDRVPLIDRTLAERRARLERFVTDHLGSARDVRLSPLTTKFKQAMAWLEKTGGAVDGVIAKRRDLPYRSGTRDGMQKIKHYRSADCVVGGFRYNEGKKLVGSLLLGLYNDRGLLDHVGFTSALKASEKPALTKKLERLIAPPGFTGTAPGGPSRWSTERSAKWEPLEPKLVIEVCYDHFTGGRFRHGTTLLRWRPDKAPHQCTVEQIKQVTANAMSLLK